ncbi:hypothetical protein ACLOJK_011783 [Asimina triloba]
MVLLTGGNQDIVKVYAHPFIKINVTGTERKHSATLGAKALHGFLCNKRMCQMIVKLCRRDGAQIGA